MRPDLILASLWRTRRAMRKSAVELAQDRQRLWARLQPWIARTPALSPYWGRRLSEFPIFDPKDLRADYGAWNSTGSSDAQLRQLANAAETGAAAAGLTAGWSSGTGQGNRGLFLANTSERADYVGQSLARLLPGRELFRKQRLALHLRASNSLYSDVRGGRFAFRHVPLEVTQAEAMDALTRFSPTILIAPPHRLLDLAKAGLRLPHLRYLFSGSEPISDGETDYLEEAFGIRPRGIYQATEGFLAAECGHGRLHLNEHAIEFEMEPVANTRGFRPIITDLRRVSQPIVRLRGDDFLELDPDPCPCGFGGRVILPPQGRINDLWHVRRRVLTPREIVQAVEADAGAGLDWQAIAGPSGVTLRTASNVAHSLASRVANTLGELTGMEARWVPDLAGWDGPKRRKVVWSGG